jgi:hypothetical protein
MITTFVNGSASQRVHKAQQQQQQILIKTTTNNQENNENGEKVA